RRPYRSVRACAPPDVRRVRGLRRRRRAAARVVVRGRWRLCPDRARRATGGPRGARASRAAAGLRRLRQRGAVPVRSRSLVAPHPPLSPVEGGEGLAKTPSARARREGVRRFYLTPFSGFHEPCSFRT